MKGSLSVAIATVALTIAALAQAPETVKTQSHLKSCTEKADAEACRAALRGPLTAKEKSLAYTYLAEADSVTEPREELLESAVKLDPNNALARVLFGAARASRGVPSPNDFLTAARLRPDWSFLYALAAMNFYPGASGTYAQWADLWKQAIVADPHSALAHTGLGYALDWMKEYPGAEREFEAAVRIDPSYPPGQMGLCITRLKQAKRKEAQSTCKHAIEQWAGHEGHRDWSYLRQVSYWAEQQKEYELALAACDRGLALEPDNLYDRSDATRILVEMGRRPEAERRLSAYVEAHPADASALEEYADLLYWSDRTEPARLQRAREMYLRVATRGTCMIQGQVAVIALRLGDYDQAFDYLKRAFVHQSDCQDVLSRFKTFMEQRPEKEQLGKRLSATLQEAEAVIITKSDAASIAGFYAMLQNWPRAAEYYQRAIESEKTAGFAAGLHWEHGRTLIEMGNYCEGLEELYAARRESPNYENGRPYLGNALKAAEQKCPEKRQ